MKYALEVHTQRQVFKREMSEEGVARRWFDATHPDGEIITDVRLWLGKTLIAKKGNN